MPPFADAMGFVDGQNVNSGLPQGLAKSGAAKTFGGHVHEIVFAGGHPSDALLLRDAVERAVDERRANVESLKLLHLILHQGDQRRDNENQTISQQSGNLVAQRFATAGGLQHQ